MKPRRIYIFLLFFISAVPAFSMLGNEALGTERGGAGIHDGGNEELGERGLSDERETQDLRFTGKPTADDATIVGSDVAFIPVTQKSTSAKKNEEEHRAAYAAVQAATNEYAAACESSQIAPLVPGRLQELHAKVLAAGDRLAVATEKLSKESNDQKRYEAIYLKNQVSPSPDEITIYGDAEYHLLDKKETVSREHSVIFGMPLCEEITRREEEDFIDLFNTKKDDMAFSGMSKDLTRATFETADQKGGSVFYSTKQTSPDDTNEERLNEIISFIGGDNGYLPAAIANLMYQKGLSILEQIAAGVGYNHISPQEVQALEIAGPIFMKLGDGKCYPKKEDPSYHLDKTIEHGETTFILTLKYTSTNELNNISHQMTRFLTFEFSENSIFNRAQPISQRNMPVTIRCRNGGIVRSFIDHRTPEQKKFEEAEYEHAVAREQQDVLPRELDILERWRDLKEAEYELSMVKKSEEELQRDYKAITTAPVDYFQGLGNNLWNPYLREKVLTDIYSKATTAISIPQRRTVAEAALQKAQQRFNEVVPSIHD